MKKILLILLFAAINVGAVSQCNIDIIVIAKNVSDSEKVFISGNIPQLGLWNPDFCSLNKINDTTWSKSFSVDKNVLLEFKFTKGSWSSEALNCNNKVDGNFKLLVTSDTCLYFRIDNWKNSNEIFSGQVTGNLKYHRNFYSKYVLPRDIIVWLPPDYDSETSERFPVLYMHDGQNIIDPKTAAFGIDWQIDETADSLIRNNSIEKIIIVGIYNTNKRGVEYSHSNLGTAYLKFIIKELKPFIDSAYKTLPDCKNTATCGSSLGGLISFILMWENPQIFSKAACLSPAFKIENIDYVAPIKSYKGNFKDLKIYIDNGGIGLEQELQPGIDEMLNELRDKGYSVNKNLLWYKDKTAEHNEAAWAKRVGLFLKYLFPKNQ